MDVKTATLVFFSPTATTRTVLEKIAQGMDIPVAESIDITRPEIREMPVPDFTGQILLIGAPVYAGRIPQVAADYFSSLKSSGAPAVPVVLYGNREFEDALLELKDILDQGGFRSMAAGAFIGEHSFSTEEFLLAPGRPDSQDLDQAEEFGRKVASLLKETEKLGVLEVPGNLPYREKKNLGPVEFIEVSSQCDECSTCLVACPVNAIDKDNGYATRDQVCIHCCACIKACPRGARTMKEGPFKDITRWLFANYTVRKEPQVFYPGSAGFMG